VQRSLSFEFSSKYEQYSAGFCDIGLELRKRNRYKYKMKHFEDLIINGTTFISFTIDF
jgi:hypothetical protein